MLTLTADPRRPDVASVLRDGAHAGTLTRTPAGVWTFTPQPTVCGVTLRLAELAEVAEWCRRGLVDAPRAA